MTLKSTVLTWASAYLLVQPLCAQQTASLFDNEIRPIFTSACQACHNDKTRTSGLSLGSRDAVLTGGNRGPALKPGSAADSLILRAVEQSGDLKMPPGRKLDPEQIASIRRWIESGAIWPEESAAAKKPKGADHWSFQPVKRVDPPQ